MQLLIRISLLISFTVFAICLSGCGASRLGSTTPFDANKPLATPKAAVERPKIVALGDSLTAGFGLAEKESYPYLLQQKLTADGYNYEIINAGVSARARSTNRL